MPLAAVEWDVESSLRYAEDPYSITRKSERVLALEVRRLRMEAIDRTQALQDWQRRALEAEEKLEAKTLTRPTVHGALGISQEHAAFTRAAYGDGVDLVMGPR